MTDELMRPSAIPRKPTLHDVIHYVAWMGYIDETKNYSATCKEASEHLEFWYAHSRATYGPRQMTRIHAVCANAWSSDFTKEQLEWASTVKNHEKWGHVKGRNWTPINIRALKYEIEWRSKRVQNLLRLATYWARINGPYVLNLPNKYGYTPVHAAADRGNVEILRLLLDAGAYPEGGLANMVGVPNVVGVRPAPFPAHRCANIIENYIKVSPLHFSETPLHSIVRNFTITHGHIDCIKLLVERGHRIDLRNAEDRTPLMLAVMRANSVAAIRTLVDLGADTTRLVSNLIYGWESPMVIDYIFKNMIDINSIINTHEHPTEDGYTFLMCAVENSLLDIVKQLIRTRALLDIRNAAGETALYLAAMNDNISMVKLLLDAGASTKIVCNHGLSPYEVANTSEIKCTIARADLARRFKKRKN